MSATLQMIAVMKTLGVITPKDHSHAPVSQGTKVMETIVQVKFFVFFQIHLKQLALVWEVTDDMLKSVRERECILTITDYIIILYCLFRHNEFNILLKLSLRRRRMPEQLSQL